MFYTEMINIYVIKYSLDESYGTNLMGTLFPLPLAPPAHIYPKPLVSRV